MASRTETGPQTKPIEPEVKVGEIVECQLTKEELAKIDAKINKEMEGDKEELEEIKRHRGARGVDPTAFHHPVG